MSNAKKAERTLQIAFSEISDADECVSADQLTDLINEFAERQLSAKSVRAHLRAMKERDQALFKNARWRVDYALAEREVTHFTRKQASS